MNSGRHMAEACSGRLQPSMYFSHTVLREYGDLKVSATWGLCKTQRRNLYAQTPLPKDGGSYVSGLAHLLN